MVVPNIVTNLKLDNFISCNEKDFILSASLQLPPDMAEKATLIVLLTCHVPSVRGRIRNKI